jgi:hypothetical protein
MYHAFRRANRRAEEIEWATRKFVNVTPPSTKYTVACRAVYRQLLGKHVSAATDTHATIEVLLERVSSIQPVQRGYKEDS